MNRLKFIIFVMAILMSQFIYSDVTITPNGQATLANNGVMNLDGNLINNGILYGNYGALRFIGPNNGMYFSVTENSFKKLYLDKTNNATVTLNSYLNILESFYLLNGYMQDFSREQYQNKKHKSKYFSNKRLRNGFLKLADNL